MSEKEYIVSLNKGVDYEAFNAEMIASTGAGAIPSRSTTIANARPASQRSTHYMLTDEEAETLKADGRVYGVNLRPDLDPNLILIRDAVQEGDFTKTTLDRGDFLNWGMRRCNEEDNPYVGVNATAGGYNYTLDGSGVDIVIQDSGIQADHPEFQNSSGVTRVVEQDWFDGYSGGGSMPTAHYTDYDGHGTHVAGTATGKTYGWAKNAKIYSIKVNGLQGTTDPNSGIPISDCFDVIKEWHAAKPVDPDTGVKRPTIVNMSWGYSRGYNSVINLTYQGDVKTGTDIDSTAKRWNFGLPPISGFPTSTYRTNVRIASVDADVQELIDAGVHVCIAAGNRSHKIDIASGDDYDNFIAADTGSVNYQRGSSPSSTGALMVGNIDSTIDSGGLEKKAVSSETGPGVDVYAPGTNIMSAMSTNNAFSATTANNPYPDNSSFLINNIGGTSMASPQVAGALALWLQLNPSATPAQAKSFITASAKTGKLYDTASSVDYTDTISLLGGNNRFLFNKFNKSTQLQIGAPAVQSAAATPTYSLARNAASVNEGDNIVITLTTTSLSDATTVPYTISGVSTADIGASLTGSFTISNNSATATFSLANDAATEGSETFTLTLDGISENISVTINDTSQTPASPTYSITPAADNIDEGNALTINVTTTNVADATTLYYTLTNSGDFTTSSSDFTITSNAGSFTVTPTADLTTEGAETFQVQIRTDSTSGTVVATSNAITINDISTTPAGPTYVSVTSPANANEGDSVAFSISTANVVDATTVPYTISGVSSADIGGASLTGDITITSNAGSLSVTLTEDVTTEGVETMTLTLGATDSAGDATGGLSTSTQVADTSTDSFTTATVLVTTGTNIYGTGNKYYISTEGFVASPALSLTEGETYRFDQSEGTNATHQLLFSTTPNGTHGGGTEYTTGVTKVGTAGQAGAYTEITVAAGAPALHYYCINHSGMGGTANAAAAYTFDATPAANNVNEGSALTVNVATANVPDTTTLYWTATNSGDFSTSTGSFTVTSNTGSFTVTPTADTTTEGSETFQVQIRTGSTSGTVVDTTDAITINDTSTTPAFAPDYTLAIGFPGAGLYSVSGTDRNGAVSGNNQALTFNVGDKVRFNNSVSGGHPLYVKTQQGSGTSNQASGVDGAGTAVVDWTIGSSGTYYYQCSIHSAMYGTITVA